MKTKRLVYFILMYLPFMIGLAALQYLPDKIPAHYGMNGQVTRWGSRYEALIFPAVTVLMGYFLLFMAKRAAKQEEYGQNNEKVIVTTGICVLILFNALTAYSLYADFREVENLSTVPVDLQQFVFGITGVMMVVIGNIMPKLRMNSVAGLRTRWSMKNEAAWKKSQRFGGISFIVGGFLVVAVSLTVKSGYCFWAVMGIWILLAAIDVIASYKIAAGS